MKYFPALLILFVTAPAALADAFEFAVSNDSVEAAYEVELSNSFSTRISGFYADVNRADIDPDSGSSIKRDTSTSMITAGLYNHGRTGPVTAHLGGFLFWANPDVDNARNGKDQMTGLALGGAVEGFITPEFSLLGGLHYAPDILTGGQYESLIIAQTRAAYRILPSTTLFAGYRYLEVTGKQLDIELYNGVYLGFEFSF